MQEREPWERGWIKRYLCWRHADVDINEQAKSALVLGKDFFVLFVTQLKIKTMFLLVRSQFLRV